MRQAEGDLVRSQQSRVETNETPDPQGAGRVLIAGEFANDWGHLGCMLAMARAYRGAGHEVLLAVSDLNAAQFFFAADDFPLLQAPVLRITQHHAPHQGEALNFADLLWGLGYADAIALAVVTNEWIALLTEIDPALLVCVNAPTAVLAAHVLRTPALFVGGAFDIPPVVSPLPSFRQVADLSEEEFAAAREAEVVESINSVMSRFQQSAIGFIGELFPAERVRLTTLPELDPFGPRGAEQYVGPVFALPTAYPAGWKDTQAGARIFVYLHPQAPACESVLQVLNDLEAEVLCVISGCPLEWLTRFSRITFHTRPLELVFLLLKAHIFITDDVVTSTTALLAGVPVLSIPRTLEQHLVAHVLEQTGASKKVENSASMESIAMYIGELLDNTKYKKAAMQVALKYFKVEIENNARVFAKELTS